MDQELSSRCYSDITLAASYGANNDKSDYSKLRKNSPASLENSPDFEALIEKIVHMHDDFNTALK